MVSALAKKIPILGDKIPFFQNALGTPPKKRRLAAKRGDQKNLCGLVWGQN